jgi:hypothetical protein
MKPNYRECLLVALTADTANAVPVPVTAINDATALVEFNIDNGAEIKLLQNKFKILHHPKIIPAFIMLWMMIMSITGTQ